MSDTITLPSPKLRWVRPLYNDPAVRTALLAFVILRMVTALVGWWSVSTNPPQINYAVQPIFDLHDIAFTTQGPVRAWLEPWYRWDAGWYIYIAYTGYRPGDVSVAFAPLYPMLIRVVALVVPDYLIASLVVSNLCCFLMFVFLYKLAAFYVGNRRARLTLLLYAIFPSAYYLIAPYAESLFLFLVICAWLAVLDEHYLVAGILAFLASLARPQAAILALPLAYIVYADPIRTFHNITDHKRAMLDAIRRLPAVLGGPLGTAAYLFGMPLLGFGSVSVAAKFEWQSRYAWPWENIISALRALIEGRLGPNDLVNSLVFIFLLIMTIVVLRRLNPALGLYALGTFLAILILYSEKIRFEGIVRYSIHFFPIFIVLSILLTPSRQYQRGIIGRLKQPLYVALSIAGQIVAVMLFTRWIWIS